MNIEEKSDVKFSEKFSLKFRKTVIVSKLFTFLTVVLLIAAFIGLNVWIQSLDLQPIDVTANKIYTLSDESKKALETIDQDIKIYVFGIDEDDEVVGLIKQYCDTNEKITYEMLSADSNLEKVQEFELEDGYSIVVIESGESRKIIDASSEFKTYDYTTYAEVDTTEQTLTNSILGMSTENKPKIYFTEGHGEFDIALEEGQRATLGVLSTYLKNEAMEIANINLMTAGSVPEDCDVLAIMSPANDFLENESQAVIDYINKGGNLFITQDLITDEVSFTNLQKVLDVYGVRVDRGYVVETASNKASAQYPYMFQPELSSSNSITADIYSDSYLLLAPYSQKLSFFSDEELEAQKITKEELIGTSENAMFVSDLSENSAAAANSAQAGKFTIAAMVTKTITDAVTSEDGTEVTPAVSSKLVISGIGRFMSDYVISQVSQQYPISYIASNKDFGINTISTLAEKENGLTLRKNMAGTSYVFTATEKQNMIVLIIIFAVPVVILLIGIIVWLHRKKRK